jgi:adenine-specific DNA-methyltransferase
MDPYVQQKMLTMLGSKRKLVGFIEGVVEDVKLRLGKEKLVLADGFCGSAVVSRMLAGHAAELYSNDFELYAHTVAYACLVAPDESQAARVRQHVDAANALAESGPLSPGFVAKHYAPEDTENIKPNERVFFTHENALRIDTIRAYVEASVAPEDKPYVIAPLIIAASRSSNSTGLFQAFMKDSQGIGAFGGKGATVSSVRRMKDPLQILHTVFNPHPCIVKCTQMDTNEFVKTELPETCDLVYYDPPYNEVSYGSNYGLLNMIVRGGVAEKVSKVAGVPLDWQRSDYYRKGKAKEAFKDLVNSTMAKTKFMLLSYSAEGHLNGKDWEDVLAPYKVEIFTKSHPRFSNTGHKGSKGERAAAKKSKTVEEVLYLVSN